MTGNGRFLLGGAVAVALVLAFGAGPAAAQTCNGQMATLVGTSGADTLVGTEFVGDVIVGNGGADTFYTLSGNDSACGGSVRDIFYLYGDHDYAGGFGDFDSIYGDTGNDLLAGHDGNDHVIGHAGNDELYGGPGSDYLSGDENTDILNGREGNDTCTSGETYVSCETIW